MSTKTFPGQGQGQWKNLAIFLALSLTLHIGGLAVLSLMPLARDFIQKFAPKEEQEPVKRKTPPQNTPKNDPLPVDLVELPPGPVQKGDPRKPATYYSDRTQSVEKEMTPDVGRSIVKDGRAPATARNVPGHSAEIHVMGNAGRDNVVKSSEKPAASTQIKPSEGDVTVPADKNGEQPAQNPAPKAFERPEIKTAPAPKAKKPNLFPTSERLAELDRKYQAEPPKAEKGKTLQLNTSEMRYARYILGMKDRIYRFWEYPEIASRNGWIGKLFVDFVINRDGKVADIKVVKSSGYPALDEAVIMALRLASPFAPLTNDFDTESFTIHAQFEYLP